MVRDQRGLELSTRRRGAAWVSAVRHVRSIPVPPDDCVHPLSSLLRAKYDRFLTDANYLHHNSFNHPYKILIYYFGEYLNYINDKHFHYYKNSCKISRPVSVLIKYSSEKLSQ